jgi:sugar phosphate permease
VIADIMRGTGRYNLAQGAVATTQGIGASISALAAGEVTDHFGYSVSFLFLAAASAVAFVVFFALMPETRDEQAIARARQEAAVAGARGE